MDLAPAAFQELVVDWGQIFSACDDTILRFVASPSPLSTFDAWISCGFVFGRWLELYSTWRCCEDTL